MRRLERASVVLPTRQDAVRYMETLSRKLRCTGEAHLFPVDGGWRARLDFEEPIAEGSIVRALPRGMADLVAPQLAQAAASADGYSD